MNRQKAAIAVIGALTVAAAAKTVSSKQSSRGKREKTKAVIKTAVRPSRW